jgi:hypothetical protein
MKMEPRMKVLFTAIMIGLATAPGLLVLIAPPVKAQQFKPMSKPVSKEREAAEEYMRKKGRDDGQYKSAIERLPDKKFDPWANMR